MQQHTLDTISRIINQTFHLTVASIEFVDRGRDSAAYLINQEYIFKFSVSNDPRKTYYKEKTILDFLHQNLKSDILIPRIEYYSNTDEQQILGYRCLDGIFLTPQLYSALSIQQKSILATDTANFLHALHSLNYQAIHDFTYDYQDACLTDATVILHKLAHILSRTEIEYIMNFIQRVKDSRIFQSKKALCHVDMTCNHFLLDKSTYSLKGIIDWGDSGITNIYTDFVYLLSDSQDEVGREFGLNVLQLSPDIDLQLADQYREVNTQYYPLETIAYGIKSKNPYYIELGRKILRQRAGF